MDEDDVWWFLGWFDNTDSDEIESGRSDKEWIGWFFLTLCVVLILAAVGAIVYSIITYK